MFPSHCTSRGGFLKVEIFFFFSFSSGLQSSSDTFLSHRLPECPLATRDEDKGRERSEDVGQLERLAQCLGIPLHSKLQTHVGVPGATVSGTHVPLVNIPKKSIMVPNATHLLIQMEF